MAQMVCPESKTSGWVWFTLAVAVIALILVVIIWIFYFVERESFLRVFDPVWDISTVDASNKTIAGENFTLYNITGNVGVAQGDFITLNQPSGGSKPGQWFIVTNLNDKSVTVQAGSGVTFQSFPTQVFTPPIIKNEESTPSVILKRNTALLPGKTSWIISWQDQQGTAINLVPGGITQS